MVHPDKGTLLLTCKGSCLQHKTLCSINTVDYRVLVLMPVGPQVVGQVSPCQEVSFRFCQGSGGSERGGDGLCEANNMLH